MLDPRVFATSAMAGVGTLLTAIQFGYWVLLVYLPPFLTTGLHVSLEISGVALLAATLPMLLVPLIGGRIAARQGWRRLFAFAFGSLLLATCCWSWPLSRRTTRYVLSPRLREWSRSVSAPRWRIRSFRRRDRSRAAGAGRYGFGGDDDRTPGWLRHQHSRSRRRARRRQRRRRVRKTLCAGGGHSLARYDRRFGAASAAANTTKT